MKTERQKLSLLSIHTGHSSVAVDLLWEEIAMSVGGCKGLGGGYRFTLLGGVRTELTLVSLQILWLVSEGRKTCFTKAKKE